MKRTNRDNLSERSLGDRRASKESKHIQGL